MTGRAAAFGFVALLLLVLAGVGWTLGAPSTFGPGPFEQGQGAYVGETTPTYWVWDAAQIWAIPTPVPTLGSTHPLTPSLLPTTSASYAINAATSGNTSVRWEFTETTAAPTSTELELRFTDGLSRAPSLITIYVETRNTAPGAALPYYLYWDAGAYGPTGVTVATMQVDVLVCTAVGHCP
jgi:hypothetical protein